MSFEEVQAGSHGGYLETMSLNRLILPFLNLYVALMSQLKFKLNSTHGSGDVQNMKMTDRPYHKLT